jgi:hypothetical protein
MSRAELLIGPVLRRVVGTRATVWVETTAPTTVTVRTANGAQGRARTFTAFAHHYALVVVEGLIPGTASPYEVLLDDRPVWPLPDSAYPPSVIRTRIADDAAQPVRLVFGSCRETTQRTTARRLPPDALDAYARRLIAAPPAPGDWPDLLVLLGDQVYADVPSPRVRQLLRRRRRPATAPADQVMTFDEYTKLYLESWRDPEIRWLLATVPSVMVFDDHEIIDDWNTSAAWRADISVLPWWAERIANGLASYWVYQHLGNLDPDALATDPILARVRATDDATEVLREFGQRIDATAGSYSIMEIDTMGNAGSGSGRYRWSYALEIGRTRLVVLDNRCDRVLNPGARSMLTTADWVWLLDRTAGDYDHLVVGASLPWLLPPGIHHLETWNERMADSARPRIAAFAERLRRALDLEHWAAFHHSFTALTVLFTKIGSRSSPPASISVLSGDVHHSYVARARFRSPVTTPVHQLTCSPLHNEVPAVMRPLMRIGWWAVPSAIVRALARAAGVERTAVRWRKLDGPYFGNAVGTLCHVGTTAEVTIEGTDPAGKLHTVSRRRLTAADPGASGRLDRSGRSLLANERRHGGEGVGAALGLRPGTRGRG